MRNYLAQPCSLWLALAICFWAGGAEAGAWTVYVAPNGNDHWSGQQPSAKAHNTDGPLATLDRALELSRAVHQREPGAETRVVLRAGDYRLGRPLILTPDDSGLALVAYPGETPVLTGEARLTGWRTSAVNPNIWETQAPGGWRFHELFYNGRRLGRARAPATGFFQSAGGVKDHPSQLRVRPGDVPAEWARDGGVELVVLDAWSQSRNIITGVDAVSNVVSLAGNVFPVPAEADPRYYIENAPGVLQPGQWRLDERSGTVEYWPAAGEDVPSANLTAPRLYDLIHLAGEEDRPLHDIVLDGLAVAGTDWRLTGGNDVDIQAAFEIEAAVQASFARDCVVQRCQFTRLGGYAVDFGHGCRHNRIQGCEMWDLGGGGVRLGDTDLGEARKYRNFGNEVTDNHIHHIGLVHAPAVGVLVFLSGSNLIAHNEIDHTYYTAISVGWAWGYADTPCRDNVVEYNHLHDVGQGMLSDMGGIYTLGVQPGTILRGNLIHDVSVCNYGGWGLYTDEGSSGMVLESNIVYHCQSSGFHQHYGETNIVRNNIFALNHDHQLMRTRAEPHLSFTLTNNIIYFDAGDLIGGNWTGDGFVIDHNIEFDTRTGPSPPPLGSGQNWADWRKHGHDVLSQFVDPCFVAPLKGDFRLRRNSPALPFGFHPLDELQAGPRKE